MQSSGEGDLPQSAINLSPQDTTPITKDVLIAAINEKRRQIRDNPRYGWELSFPDFSRDLHYFSVSQQYGTRFENRFAYHFGYEKISEKDMGDLRNAEGKISEVKFSIVSKSSKRASFKNIRLWEPVDFYACSIYDEKIHKVLYFKLTKKEMEEELALNGHYTSGSRMANKSNSKATMSFSISWGARSEVRQRWMDNYFVCYLE